MTRSGGRAKRREPELFLNRELSWLSFNTRVLEEALDAATPLLERLKFIGIVAGNLDEFFMVRVSALQHAVSQEDSTPDPSGLTPQQQLVQISDRAHEMMERLYQVLWEHVLPALAERGVRLLPPESWDQAQREHVERLFKRDILPTLTPLAIDFSRPFPMLAGLSLNIAVALAPIEGASERRLAVVQVPAGLPRLLRLPGAGGSDYCMIEDVIRTANAALFPGQEILESGVFRVTRDAEMELDDEGGRDYVQTVEEELRKRRRSRVVRLEIENAASEELGTQLRQALDVNAADVYRPRGPLEVRSLAALSELPALDDLRDPPQRPLSVLEPRELAGMFALLDERSVVLTHPYDSFDPVVALLTEAAADPDVLAIKQTLYRISPDSPIARALVRAAEQGKQVTVLVELMARFDEQSNIRWARTLEEAGAHAIYGLRDYKTHAKICLIVKRSPRGIRRYVHLGTGNYNERTARLYTDFGFMTADDAIGQDASAFFNSITGYSDPPRMRKLVMAPSQLRERLLWLIERERLRAAAGQVAEIRAKMNALVDEDIIRALYEASRAGVRVRLNVRGICCLRPGVKGVSETIEVVSVVDRYLEHARILHVRNGGDDEVYLASADWMPRNLDRRIELMFPVEPADCRAKVLTLLDAMFLDNVKSRALQGDGSYRRRRPPKGEEPYRAQLQLYREAQRAIERQRAVMPLSFEPLTPPAREDKG